MATPFSWNAAVLLRKQAAAKTNQATIELPTRDFFTVTWQSHLYFSFSAGARSLIPPHHRARVRARNSAAMNGVRRVVLLLLARESLCATLEEIAEREGTDKARDEHGYVSAYAMLFDGMRDRVRNVTEIGIHFVRVHALL